LQVLDSEREAGICFLPRLGLRKEVKMGKSRRNFKRRDFMRAGILGGVALSLWAGRLFATIVVPSESRKAKKLNSSGEAHPISFDIVEEYGAEFGGVKPIVGRHRHGCF
jgi:hypothetical protein